ncbi:WRKY transcription factor 22-like [Impatiens glandulifera]|uniref:WRKY transcription factor 22-like n=1 Tax=Impatiens glandulifera TaxID=253017 RepID=UPI001FB0784E|nr:WRKY transcription factor 22-like [Impatiens glandulifera]
MTDFAGAGDWDLRAVVRGCNFSMDDHPHTCFSPLITDNNNDDDLIFGNFVFPEYLFDSNTTASNNSDLDLEDLYKPFYPTSSNHCTFSPQSTSSEKLLSDDSLVGTAVAADADCSKAVGSSSKYRKRKNQHKRVVMEVTAEGLSSDMWAWRKYGQKPIKGSPYPRSYYRCSSSRGCPARKQVERSHSDPTTFIITYTAEHNHSKPTRRNSLAGTTRQRFSNSPVSIGTNKPTLMEDVEDKKKMKNKKNVDRIRSVLLKKNEMETGLLEDRFINEAAEENVISHDHHMMIMNDDFFVDFEEQLNDIGFNQTHSATTTTTTSGSSFW